MCAWLLTKDRIPVFTPQSKSPHDSVAVLTPCLEARTQEPGTQASLGQVNIREAWNTPWSTPGCGGRFLLIVSALPQLPAFNSAGLQFGVFLLTFFSSICLLLLLLSLCSCSDTMHVFLFCKPYLLATDVF